MTQQKKSFADRNVFPSGKSIDGFEVMSLVGIGGFGEVYKVKDKKTNQMFAMKTEDINAQVKGLDVEIECIQKLNDSCFPKIRSVGQTKKVKYIVMNIYGSSISSIRLKTKDGKLPLDVSLPVGLEMIKVIEKFHSYGYVHRDIKPSNFLVQQNEEEPLVLIDFGLTKMMYDENGHLLDVDFDKQFVGTKKYSSIYAHYGNALGKRDDLISWFYSLLELIQGSLPWSELSSNSEALECKEKISPKELCKDLPKEFVQIFEILYEMELESNPDYSKIKNIYTKMMEENNISPGSFNWLQFYTKNSSLSDIRKTLELYKTENKDDKNSDESNNEQDEMGDTCCCIF